MSPVFAFIGSGFSYMEMIFMPEVFRTFGNIMTQLRTASREFKTQVMDVEQQIKAEVRDIEATIEKEAKALEGGDEDTVESEYSFEDDPYHADMHDEAYNEDHGDDPDHPDHAEHDVWEDDYSDYDCPEDRARRELEAAAESLVNGDSSGSSDSGSTSKTNGIAGTVPYEIPPGLETPVRRSLPEPEPEPKALADRSSTSEHPVDADPDAEETEESRDATA